MSGGFRDAADWAGLTHAYGAATNLPDTLEQVGSDDPAVVERALYDLSGSIYHQGWVYPATVPAVGVLYELVSHPGTHLRPRILGLLSEIAGAVWDLEDHDEDEYGEPDLATVLEWARAARAAVETGVPTLMSLLDDGDPAVRAAAPFVLADFPEHDPDPVPRLRQAADAEGDAGAAASMILAVADICTDRDEPPLDWLRGHAADTRREVRAAAAVALLWCGADDLDDDGLQAITAEIQADESALDGQLWVLDGGRTGFLTSALDQVPAPQISLARAALATDTDVGAADAERRVQAVHRAGQIMRTWRAGPAGLLPPLADLLTDDDAEVVKEAVWEIKQGGPDIALVADRLLPLLDGDVQDHPQDLIAGSALEALGRAGDARCVPALAADLDEPRLSFNPGPAIAGMKEHADALLEPVRAFLDEPKKGTGFAGNHLMNVLAGLAEWGDRAQPLLPDMISLLERRKAVPHVARALAALGPAAADAVPVLRRYLGRKHGPQASQNAAWAIWQITGDGEEPLRFLTSAIRNGLDDEDIERLFALGSAARPALPLLDEAMPGAAAVIQRVTGDTERTLPHLVDAVAATPTGMLAVRCLGEIGADASAAVPDIREIAESPRVLAGGASTDVLATDRAYQAVAAEALARITGEEGDVR
ncbi:armadillo/beta-catenin-like repeat-containing protein [Actinomadura sp. 1N219]|uniref:armadillo/beta-catenin-like repeat-containing protein n=1 Tax=Actinomadura sp. 1N219 TaxID=3375152 RepID=UPI0037A81AA7